MSDLLLHPATKSQTQDFIAAPSHAVLILGPSGSGKKTLSGHLSETVLGINSISDYAYATTIRSEEGKAIGIEAIRTLEHFLSLKVPSDAAFNRVIIIEDAHLLTIEAQNALLKTLEEPPQGTLLVLSATSEQSLLPTIRSRAQAITIKRPSLTDTTDYFAAQGFSAKDIQQAMSISGGLPGLMQALLSQGDHPLLVATQKARQILSGTTYERVLLVDELSKQRELAADTLFILQQMAHISLQTADAKATARWQTILSSSYDAAEALNNSGQPKLVLTNLLLQL